jgi:hypothetical protein
MVVPACHERLPEQSRKQGGDERLEEDYTHARPTYRC